MQATPSLFAQKLRETRAALGVNGRLTQEQLAERLGVSVDAVSKYERSLSYIRGDLEHRLSEKLGWARDDVCACRLDWEQRAETTNTLPYRTMDQATVDEYFDGSWAKAIDAKIAFAQPYFSECPEDFEAGYDRFHPVYNTFRGHWSCIVRGPEVVAIWSMFLLLPEDEQEFLECRFLESEICVDRFHQPILPGTYFGYCPGLVIKSGCEGAGVLLMTSFVDYLERLARQDMLFHGLSTYSVTAAGAQLCRQFDMDCIGQHIVYPNFEGWVFSGRAIANSIFARKSPYLKRVYSEAFPGD